MKIYKRIERRFLIALVSIVERLICADHCISMAELQSLKNMEEHFGFNRTLMSEAHRMTLQQAVAELQDLDCTIRVEMLDDLSVLAGIDRVVDKSEALLLLSLKYVLSERSGVEVLSCAEPVSNLDFSGCLLYVESKLNETYHQELSERTELLQLQLQQEGLQLMYVEQMAQQLTSLDSDMIRLLLGYMAPQMTDEQIQNFYQRVEETSSSDFCERVLIDGLQLDALRNTEPCLLMGIGGNDFLRIPLQGEASKILSRVLADYRTIASRTLQSQLSAARAENLQFDGYSKLFLSLLVKAAPRKSPMVVWPNKSEFTFPAVCRTLRLNQQEATLLTLVLLYSTTGKCQGLPLSYSSQQKRIEAQYRSIYCRKKLVETSEVIYPDNLAPIRARIEKKMREQLTGLENLEDFIPLNRNHDGHYSVVAPPEMIQVCANLHENLLALDEYKW